MNPNGTNNGKINGNGNGHGNGGGSEDSFSLPPIEDPETLLLVPEPPLVIPEPTVINMAVQRYAAMTEEGCYGYFTNARCAMATAIHHSSSGPRRDRLGRNAPLLRVKYWVLDTKTGEIIKYEDLPPSPAIRFNKF